MNGGGEGEIQAVRGSAHASPLYPRDLRSGRTDVTLSLFRGYISGALLCPALAA